VYSTISYLACSSFIQHHLFTEDILFQPTTAIFTRLLRIPPLPSPCCLCGLVWRDVPVVPYILRITTYTPPYRSITITCHACTYIPLPVLCHLPAHFFLEHPYLILALRCPTHTRELLPLFNPTASHLYKPRRCDTMGCADDSYRSVIIPTVPVRPYGSLFLPVHCRGSFLLDILAYLCYTALPTGIFLPACHYYHYWFCYYLFVLLCHYHTGSPVCLSLHPPPFGTLPLPAWMPTCVVRCANIPFACLPFISAVLTPLPIPSCIFTLLWIGTFTPCSATNALHMARVTGHTTCRRTTRCVAQALAHHTV